MSDPGTPLTLQDLQTLQDQQRRQQMAQALLSGQGATGANSGLANAGNSILGAMVAKNMQGQISPAAQAMVQRGQVGSLGQANSILNPSFMDRAGNYVSNLFGLGGGS